MQSEIFQAFICYNFDDCGLQLMKSFSQYSYLSVSHNNQNYNQYWLAIFHFAYKILVSSFKLNY